MASNPTLTILVVDDNPASRYATSRVLRSAGFAVLEAGTGGEGLASAVGADLVILDVHLPDIDGFEVCRRIRSVHQTARMPVIHLSATFVRDTDKVEGLDAGADGYLTHPVEPLVLVATVNAFLRTRRAEDEMQRSEAKFRAIFDQALSGILLVSKDLVYLEANPAMCQILGRSRDEIVGRHNSSFVPPGHEDATAAIVRDVEERGSWRGTFPLIGRDGKHIELEWSIARYSVPGVRLAIVNDITERHAHELERERLLAAERAARAEAEHANRLKDEFLATLSHEMRTPLNAIVGWSQILKTGVPSAEDIAEGVDAIARNAHSQAQLISDLLDVSRITSGKLRLDVRQVDLVATVEEALASTTHALTAKGLHLQRSLDPAVGFVGGDPDRIQQVIWNLVNNAVKFTPRGGTIRIALEREGSTVVITVADEGKGIKADFLPYIFERFRQENASTRRNQGGLGLGLAIAKHLVEMHGGTITAHSDGEGRGATFTVRLPIAPAQSDAAEENAGSVEAVNPNISPSLTTANLPTRHLSGVRVLIVDDEPDARAVLSRVLARGGAEVSAAPTAQAALAILKTFNPNILISDIGMPEADGYDLIRAIRKTGLSAQQLPAIALTAFARSEDHERSVQAGFQLHLSKPIDAAELVAAVVTLLHRENASA